MPGDKNNGTTPSDQPHRLCPFKAAVLGGQACTATCALFVEDEQRCAFLSIALSLRPRRANGR